MSEDKIRSSTAVSQQGLSAAESKEAKRRVRKASITAGDNVWAKPIKDAPGKETFRADSKRSGSDSNRGAGAATARSEASGTSTWRETSVPDTTDEHGAPSAEEVGQPGPSEERDAQTAAPPPRADGRSSVLPPTLRLPQPSAATSKKNVVRV